MTVQEIFDRVVLSLSEPPRCHLFEALREVQGIVVGRLLARQSSYLRADEPAWLEFGANEKSAPLPDDFKALDGRPLLNNKPLAPIGNLSPQSLPTSGQPKFFQLSATTLQLIPVPTVTTTIEVPYFFRPPVLKSFSDSLPFNGEFDQVFSSGARELLIKGVSAVADRGFVTIIQAQVDAVLEGQAQLDEQHIADDINGL